MDENEKERIDELKSLHNLNKQSREVWIQEFSDLQKNMVLKVNKYAMRKIKLICFASSSALCGLYGSFFMRNEFIGGIGAIIAIWLLILARKNSP